MRNIFVIILLCSLIVFGTQILPFGPDCQAHAIMGGPLRQNVESIIKALSRKGPKATSELAGFGGEAGVRQVAERALLEGGDEALAGLKRLTKTYGVDALRAADNAVNIPGLIRAVDDLPQDMIGPALRRLSGSQGRVVADMVERYGSVALRAEARHPRVGIKAVQNLGEEGADIVAKMNRNQAVTVGRHLDDIGNLPANQKKGVLNLLHQDLERVVAFLGRFVENHPGKVLFTTATTSIVLAKSDHVLGDAEIVYDDQGNPHVVTQPGIIERTVKPVLDALLFPLALILGITLFLYVGIRISFSYLRQKKKYEQWLREQRSKGQDVEGGDELAR